MNELSDHPVIASILRTGYPAGSGGKAYECPICGNPAEQVIRSLCGEIVGCRSCLTEIEMWEMYEPW